MTIIVCDFCKAVTCDRRLASLFEQVAWAKLQNTDVPYPGASLCIFIVFSLFGCGIIQCHERLLLCSLIQDVGWSNVWPGLQAAEQS